MVHGKMTRNLSSHVSTPGHYRKRKLSMSDVQNDAESQQLNPAAAADKLGSLRRARRASADLEGYDYRQAAGICKFHPVCNRFRESERRQLQLTIYMYMM